MSLLETTIPDSGGQIQKSRFTMLTAKTSFHRKRLSRMMRILLFWVSFCAEIITSALANTKNAPCVPV